MKKLLYDPVSVTVEPTSDIVLYSVGEGDNAYYDPWGYVLAFEDIE